ncbi:MAG: response regulator [Chloroflexota bacterium]|nr:response regulator [Chloroflexota bacterium]
MHPGTATITARRRTAREAKKDMAEARILIAEDNELVARTLEEQLTTLGYEVAGVARTAEAVRLCEQLRPDLVLMDMQMPELSGDAARQIGERTSTPVVIMTAFSDVESVHQAEEAGALAYLVKPVNPEELPPAIDVALARHRELQQLREHVEDLQETLESRKLIERAKGILMKRLKISDAEAEENLRQRAKDKKVHIKDIAQAIVDSDALLS